MKLFLSLLIASSLSGCTSELLDQLAQAGAAYASGYSESYNAYHPYCPPAPYYHSGIITQAGQAPAFYSLDSNGGYIIQPGQAPVIITGY